jgi:hypothetical protein
MLKFRFFHANSPSTQNLVHPHLILTWVDLHQSSNWPWLRNFSTSEPLAKVDDYPSNKQHLARLDDLPGGHGHWWIGLV